jgi:DNA polymerase bacteriophage-type
VPQIAKTYWREMERYVYELDQDMNCRGFRVDPEMLDSVLCMLEKLHPLMEQKLSELTNGEVQKVQSPKLRPYLQSEFLMELPNLQKDTVAAVLDENDLDARARELLLLRKHGARNSLAKYGRVSSMVSADLRVRAGYLYYGASTTGRWAGQGCQPQNLPRPTEESHDPVEIARACVQCSGDPAALEMLYDEPIYDVLVSGIRGCVVPAPGSVFVIGDYSQIESRITAWYAHCNLKLQAFHEHDTGQSGLDPYERTALDVLGDPSFRFEGKTMDLGLGFGMGVDKFSAVAKLEPARARELCYGWRETYPEIPRLWGTLAAALHRTLGNSFQTRRLEDPGIRDLLSVRGVRARKHNNQLVSLTLPSGRPLFYHGLRYATWGECMARAALHNRVSETKSRFGRYMGRDYVSGDDAALPNTSQLSCIHAHGYRKFLHGGLVTENIVQGLARDVLCEHALQLWQDYALLPVLHSHDELVYEVSENDAEATRELVRSYMEKGVSFLSSLPIRAEVSISPRYTKS